MTAGALAGYETTRIGGSDPHLFARVVATMAVVAAALAWLHAALSRRRAPNEDESR
jgi:hypothetical protein